MTNLVTLPVALDLEGGGQLAEVRIAYQAWGTLNATRSNAILVLHALTGDSHVTGPTGPDQPTPGWWEGLVGPGLALDTNEFYVVAPNVLGGCRGSTGPSSPAADGRPWGSRFPRITVRDQVTAEALFSDVLGIQRWAAVLGGSMGGMRAVEWVVGQPDRVARALILACPAASSAEQIGWASPQLHAIRADPNWHGGDYYGTGTAPTAGLGIARRIAHVTYRAEAELESRFGRQPQGDENPLDGGRFAIESYLDHHADKLIHRFDAGSYVVLTEAMNTHDVGRDRGGVAAALARVTARTVVAGVDSDRLYPLYQQVEMAEGIPTSEEARVIHSPFGHDAFLIETKQIATLIKEMLSR